MVINYWAILVCGIVAMVLGALWYGPLFGAAWGRICGVDMSDKEAMKKMQKKARPLYFMQFVTVLFEIWVLSTYSSQLVPLGSLINAVWIWLGFVVPTIVSTSLWNNESRKNAWARFLVQAGYQLLIFIAFGCILGYWQ